MFEWVFYFIVYMCAGFTLKLGDDLLDEMERSTFAWLPLAISGILFGYLMTQTEWDLALFTAIIAGVILSGKVNRPQFAIGFFFIVLTILVIGIPVVTDWLAWSALLFMLFMASMLDEKGNDWTDEEIAPAAFKFFQYRFALKLSVLLLTKPWPQFLPAAVGLWMFDLGYELAGRITRHRH